MPFSWAASMASASCKAICNDSCTVNAPLCKRSARSGPGTSSMARLVMFLSHNALIMSAFLCGATNLAAKAAPPDEGSYTAADKEYYLTPEQILFIRPGLELTIHSIDIPADLMPEVTFTISDPAGLGLDMSGVTTPGPGAAFVDPLMRPGDIAG